MGTGAEDLFVFRCLFRMVDSLLLGEVSIPCQLASEPSTAMDAFDFCRASSVLHIGPITLAREASSKEQ